MRDLAAHVAVEIEGVSNVADYIDEFTDVTTESVDDVLTPGGLFNIAGHKIKLFGDNPDVGVCFVSADEAGLRFKVSGHLAENTVSKLIGGAPALGAGLWKVEITTQYAGSGNTVLKSPRVIESAFTLTVAEAAS
ncbi:MAG: DUF4469 domain-containing protein [Treponema sp.]|nr:DUF4469 domain-containing protein [Treponema sp.]